MNQNEIYERLKIIVEQKLAPQRKIVFSNDATLDSLGLDSLDRVELVMLIEEDFGIAISDDAADSIKTVKDLVSVIEQSVLKTD
ncbi:acyl carrier protein [Candidatus Dependentiae bacterium]|nr:acyl carrier protein [Candidatus Dependentiae bacterium]